MKLIVAMTGASGVIYGKRLLEMLHRERVETHLVMSQAAERIIEHELNVDRKDLKPLPITRTKMTTGIPPS